MSLISVPEAKKASNDELVAALKKLSDILATRYENDPDLDTDQVFRSILADECYSNPASITEPFIVNNAMIAIPTVPKKGSTRGNSVLALIQVPGSEPYYSYSEGTETFLEASTIKLRGYRSVSLHRIIPGMVVSFHHYAGDDTNRDRIRIDAGRVVYDDNGEAVFVPTGEEDALFAMPNPGAPR